MAERRMFAKTIIDSDAFLDMPMSAQLLYFHLSMRADDEGFLNNPKKIQRMIGASEDDLKLLILKKFIISFDTGVVVIKHWRINNYLQKDRCKPTIYQSEKAMLGIKPSKAYTLNFDDPNTIRIEDKGKKDVARIQDVSSSDTSRIQDVSNMDTEHIQNVYSMDTECIHDQNSQNSESRMDTGKAECIQNGYKMYTQDRLDKINRLINLSIYQSDSQLSIQDFLEQIRQTWNSLSDYGVAKINILGPTTDRASDLVDRMLQFGYESFNECVENIKKSDYLLGRTDSRKYPIDFKWLITGDNYAYVYEGKYTNHPASKGQGRKVQNFLMPSVKSYDGENLEELESKLLDN